MEFISKIVFSQDEKNVQKALEHIQVKLCEDSTFNCEGILCKECQFNDATNKSYYKVCYISTLIDAIQDVLKVMEENE